MLTDDAREVQTLRFETTLVSMQAGSVILSGGTLLWVIRSTGLMAAMLTSLPAWRGFDPLVLLAPGDERQHFVGDAGNTELDLEEAGAAAMFTVQAREPRPTSPRAQ